VPSLTFAGSANAVLATGARPVFCDVSADDFCIDLESAASMIGRATRAIMPVYLYGQVADMDAVQSLAKERGVLVVEDACQAHGATYKGKTAGSFATAAFSLYATKNVMSGEGGVVTTNDRDIARRLRLLRNHGMEERYVHLTFGMNLRMSEMQAALARTQLGRLAQGNERRRVNAAFYSKDLHGLAGLILPVVQPEREHVWHQYTLRVPDRRDIVLDRLRAAGVGADVYYPTPVHKQRAFSSPVNLPTAELLAREVMSIPVYPSLTDEERALVAKALTQAIEEDG
jgi:perosamine synthetase